MDGLPQGTGHGAPPGDVLGVGEFLPLVPHGDPETRRRGDVIEVVGEDGQPLARGQAQYNAVEAARIAGRHSRDIDSILGFRYDEALVHRDDLVLLDGVAHPTEATT